MVEDWSAAVAEFIAAESLKPFVWGRTDCAATTDRWLAALLGYSPMAAFGRLRAYELAGEAKGVAVSLNRVMRACGIPRTKEPKAGDVGLILHGDLLCVSINAGSLWFSRSAAGLIGAPLSAAWKAWKVT